MTAHAYPTADEMPLRGTGKRPLVAWYRRHPETFRAGRSPGRTVLFVLMVVVGVVVTGVVLSDPDAAARLLSGDGAQRRTGAAFASALIVPPTVALLGLVGVVRWCRRWLLIDTGAVMTVGTSRTLPDDVDPESVTELIRRTAGDPDGFATEFGHIRHDPDGRTTLVIETSSDATALVALLWRREDTGWSINHQPVVLRGDDAFPVLTTLRDHEQAAAEARKSARNEQPPAGGDASY